MNRRKNWRSALPWGLAAFAFGAIAQELPPGSPAPKWGPHIDFEAKPGSKRNLGEADFFLPLSQDAHTLVFSNLRARFDDQSGYEGNFGVGVRRMLDNGWNLGAYGYWDHRRSGTGNFFDQATLGIESLGRDWELRANGYLPVGTRAYTLGNDSTAVISGASVQVTTTTREERALKGIDAEIGWRVPLFDSEAARQLRLYVGGYRFADAGVKVEGPRLRAELTLEELPWFGKGTRLYLSAETQDDNARGGQSFLGVRLRIPLGKETAQARNLTAQERRMTAPVMRDVDIVTQSRIASTLVETATQTASGQTFTVLNSATTTGAALPGAVTAAGAGSTVILSGTFNTAGNTISLQANQTLTGSLSVRSASGRVATLNTGAAVHATNATDTVIVNSNGTLSGLTITNTFSGGLGGRGVLVAGGAGGVSITNNTISVNQTAANAAVALAFSNGTSGTISGNTLTVTGTGGATTMTALAINVGGGTTATVTGNSMSASGGTTNNMAWVTGATINAGSTGNIRGSGACNGAPASGSIAFTNGTTCP